MFKKLRNRFLVLNLVIISVMMLISFATIYTITYRNVRADIDMELFRIADFYEKPGGKPGYGQDPDLQVPGDRGPPPEEEPIGDSNAGGPSAGPTREGGPPERSVHFTIVTDAEGAVLLVASRFEMDDAFYATVAGAALSEGREVGQLRADGNDWAYVSQPMSDGGARLVFLDVTARQAILTNLVYTFLVVGFVMLIVIFFLSRFFANRSIAPVQEAFDKQKQFIADASHELKTPLAVIRTNVDVLLANEEDTVRNQSKWLRYIQSETDRMSKLTSDLLYLTRMEDAREEVVFAKFSMSDAVENVVLMLEAAIFEKRLTLESDIEPGLAAFGNAEQMKQVVLILLDNAMKYANDGGAIQVNLSRQHNELLLSVANTGEGIAPEQLERIFDRFYRTDPSRARNRGGYGLGLAIAKSIVDRHKGRIYAKSALQGKTTFYVQLPPAS
ncbi:HAMP domain-containing histidine kinase [Paenibacillus sp. TRM 82003]|nr:HAMP domain-containing histidine kinase [Paenibacillus sp. TRM 82003]